MGMEAPSDGLLPEIIPKTDATWQLEYSVRKDNRVKRRPQVSLTNLTDFFIIVSVLSARGIGFSKGWFLRRNKIGNCHKKSLPGQGWNRQNRQVRDSHKRYRIEHVRVFRFSGIFSNSAISSRIRARGKKISKWYCVRIHYFCLLIWKFSLF